MSAHLQEENPALIQLRTQHWSEMAMTILREEKGLPTEFGVMVTPESIEVCYPDGMNIEKGDYFTPGYSELTLKERNLEVTKVTTAKDVFEFLADCVEEAKYYEKQLM